METFWCLLTSPPSLSCLFRWASGSTALGILTASTCGLTAGDTSIAILSSANPTGGPYTCEGCVLTSAWASVDKHVALVAQLKHRVLHAAKSTVHHLLRIGKRALLLPEAPNRCSISRMPALPHPPCSGNDDSGAAVCTGSDNDLASAATVAFAQNKYYFIIVGAASASDDPFPIQLSLTATAGV